MGVWADVSTPPQYGLPVIVELEDGRALIASYERDASMTDGEQPCDQWWAIDENAAPPCWTDGACWASNADEIMSLQPVRWRKLSPNETVRLDGLFERRIERKMTNPTRDRRGDRR